MRIVRKLALTTAAAIVSVGLAALTAPAASADTAWGCGGLCAVGEGSGG